jgi:drug/metabolite transporter (DMT)-like permease
MFRPSALVRLAAGAIIISFAPILVRLAHTGPTTTGVYRMAIGALGLAVVVAWRRGRWWPGGGHLRWAVLAGALITVDLWLWHRSILYVGPGLATILANLQVCVLAAVGVLFFREPLTARLVATIALALGGLFLMVGLEWRSAALDFRLGSVFGLTAAAAYAAYLLALRRVRNEWATFEPALTIATIAFLAALFLSVVALAEGESFAIPDGQTALALVALGLGPQVAGWLLITGALPHVRASTAGLALLLQPALAFMWDVAFFSRATTAIEVAGAVLALAAIYFGIEREAG